jgi:hypothetical protein
MSDKDEQDTQGTEEQGSTDERDWKAEAEKWKALARKHEGNAKANAEAAKRLSEIEDEAKSEAERLAERVQAAEARAAEAEGRVMRYEVAASKGLTPAQARRLVGSTVEELEADADELLAAFKAPDTGEDGSDSDDDGDAAGLSRRPSERLRPGAANDAEPDETDPAKLAAMIPRS